MSKSVRPMRSPFGASTLGTPGTPLEVVLSWLQAEGATFLELRVGSARSGVGLHEEPIDTRTSAADRRSIREQIRKAGVTELAVASTIRLGSSTSAQSGGATSENAESDDEVVYDLADHIHLAADLGARFIRVFPGGPLLPGPSDRLPELLGDREVLDDRLVRRLEAVARLAADRGVRILLETHDSHPRGADLSRVLRRLDADGAGESTGAIWDVLHPYRVGEPVAETAQLLAPYLLAGRGYVQVKDVNSRRDLTPVVPDEGILPLRDFFSALADIGYDGPVSLEWERRWYPDVAELPAPLRAIATMLKTERALE
jgi:sugar phosphate isomerase/epimerase